MTWDEAIKCAEEMAAEVEKEIKILKRKRARLLNSARYFKEQKRDGLEWGFWNKTDEQKTA